ncbi:MAG: glutaminyl-peptide cyclotransferase [Chloroflexales bacterium]|nr:glutaminyl-peptide cyclotransferase [Chloroflexales bacterium]
MRFLLPAFILAALLNGCGAAPTAPSIVNSAPIATATTAPTSAPTTSVTPFVVTLGAVPTATVLIPTVVNGAMPTYGYKVLASYPHDAGAWTQGLVYIDGALYEGTGPDNGGNVGGGPSSLRRVNLETGTVEQRQDLPIEFYGEGIAVYGDTIVQISWKNQTGFVYDRASFKQRRTFAYSGEGWGITYDGRRLIMSDGTSRLRFLDPVTFAEIGSVEVIGPEGPLRNINELEYVDGVVYANIWQTDRIARIDPQTGKVTGIIDLSGLLGPEDRQRPVDVLNGITYDAANKRLLVTGKLWPKLFAIELVPKN